MQILINMTLYEKRKYLLRRAVVKKHIVLRRKDRIFFSLTLHETSLSLD